MRLLFTALYYGVAYHLPHRYFPLGRLCSRFRAFLVKRLLGARCGIGLEIEGQVLLGKFTDVSIGNHVQINERARLRHVSLGDHVMIAPEVYVLHSGHEYRDRTVPMRFQGETHFPETIIEDDVWVGARAVILPGRRLGRGSIVAAGSVVVHDVEPYTIVGGNPATLIRVRP